MPAATGLLVRSADACNNPARHGAGCPDAREHGHRLSCSDDPGHDHNKDPDTREDTNRDDSRTIISNTRTGLLSLHRRFLRDAHDPVIV